MLVILNWKQPHVVLIQCILNHTPMLCGVKITHGIKRDSEDQQGHGDPGEHCHPWVFFFFLMASFLETIKKKVKLEW